MNFNYAAMMFENIDPRFERRHARRSQCTRRRAVVRACAALALAVPLIPGPAAAQNSAADPGYADPGPSLAGRLGGIAGTLYDKAQTDLVAPSRRVAEEVLADPRAQTMYRHLSDAAQDLVALADTHVVEPIARESPGLMGQIRLSYQAVSAIAGDLMDRLRHHLFDPPMAGQQPEIHTIAAQSGTASGLAGAAGPPRPVSAIPDLSDSDILRNLNGDDPLEPVNRFVFRLNGVWQVVLEPLSRLYLDHTTSGVQVGIGNFFRNLREPATLVSSVLEGQLADAGTAAARFGINSTLGIAGFRDPATDFGLSVRPRNLEETLCVYGLPSGPYLVLPVLGPATLRDTAGRIATVLMYFEVMGAPIYVPYRISDIAVQYANVKDKMDLINKLSTDPYMAQKALYLALRDLGCFRQAVAYREFFTK